MPLTFRESESQDFVSIIWEKNDSEIEGMINYSGVNVSHSTHCISGTITIWFFNPDLNTIVLGPNEQTVLPLGEPYAIVGQEPIVVHCHYPKGVPGALEDISALRTITAKDWTTMDQQRVIAILQEYRDVFHPGQGGGPGGGEKKNK